MEIQTIHGAKKHAASVLLDLPLGEKKKEKKNNNNNNLQIW